MVRCPKFSFGNFDFGFKLPNDAFSSEEDASGKHLAIGKVYERVRFVEGKGGSGISPRLIASLSLLVASLAVLVALLSVGALFSDVSPDEGSSVEGLSGKTSIGVPEASEDAAFTTTYVVAEGLSEDPGMARENSLYLQRLISRMSYLGGGTVELPAGRFCFAAVGEHAAGDYAIKMRDDVKILGAGMEETVLMPVGVWAETGDYEHGVDMFVHFGVEEGDYLENADFEKFTIDASLTCGNPDAYNASGKGFFFKLFKDCDWRNVAVKNTDGTGFGMDFPINSTLDDCLASGCGKNATSEDVGASGFGIGTGYSELESIVIRNCEAYDNTKFGFFFEHQTRFDSDIEALSAAGFAVVDCSASGNLYNFGGARAHDVTYERCVSELSEDIDREVYTVRAFCFENHSCRTSVLDCTVEQRFADVSPDDACYEAAVWALSESLIESGAWSNGEMLFHAERDMLRAEAVALLWRYAGRPGGVLPGGSPDVPENHVDVLSTDYYADAVLWMSSIGDATLTEFRGEDPITQAELITMMWRMAGKPEAELDAGDLGAGSGAYYADALAWACEQGLAPEDLISFEPDRVCSRAEVVVLLHSYDKIAAVVG